MKLFQTPGQWRGNRIFAILLTILVLLPASACGTPPTQQQAHLNKAQFDQQLAHAQSIGVPPTALQPVLRESEQLSSTRATGATAVSTWFLLMQPGCSHTPGTAYLS